MRQLTRTSVLIVEDDAALRELYRKALAAAGYAAVGVEDGIDALRRIDHGKVPQAIVLDLALPRLNGQDLSRELRAHPDTRHVPVIVVTGTDTRKLNPADFACVFRKPVNTDALIRAVEACLQQSQLGG